MHNSNNNSKKNKTKIIAEAVARFPYQAPDKRHLSLQKHETLKLIQQHESGWWIGQNQKGNVGFFPSNYVQVTKWFDEESRKKYNGDNTDAKNPSSQPANPSKLQWNRPMTHKKPAEKSETDVMMESLGFGADEMEALLSDEDDDSEDDNPPQTSNNGTAQDTEPLKPSTQPQLSPDQTLPDSQQPLNRDNLVTQEKYNRLKEQTEQLQNDYDVLKKQMKENKQVEIQKRQNKLLQTQIQKLKDEKDKLSQLVDDYRTSTGLLPNQRTSSDSQQNQDQSKQSKQEISSLKSQISSLNAQLSAAKSSPQSTAPSSQPSSESASATTIDSQELNNLRQQIQDLNQQISEKSEKIDQLTEEMTGKDEQLSELNTELDSFKEQQEKEKNDSEQAENAQVAKLTKDLNLSKNKLEKQKKLTNDIKKKYADVITKLDADLKKTKKELEEKTKRVEILEKQNEDSAKLASKFRLLKQMAQQFRRDQQSLYDDTREQLSLVQQSMTGFTSNGFKPLTAALKDASEKYKEEAKKRKLLYNELQDLKGKIRICVRVRPILKSDHSEGACVKCLTDIGEVRVSDHEAKKTYKYEFDKVFNPKTGQQKVFEEVKGLATSILDGYNVCIFAYGQTGSGKTHTMDGSAADRGLNYRTIAELFKIRDERKEDFDYTFRVSCTEIYMEQVYDLLAKTKTPLKLQMAGGTTKILDLTKVEVEDTETVLAQFDRSKQNRAQACTDMNEHSSRSHALVTIYVKGVNKISGVKYTGKLHLIDLAGSERVKLSGVSGQRMDEAKSINSSLSALGDVISALGAKKGHIPYRNSKLTSVLQDSLGGHSKVMMFVNASPCTEHASETVCSLKFANRVRKVELGSARQNVEGGKKGKGKK